MRTPREVTKPLRGTLTTVPPCEVGACRVCHGAPKPGFQVCFACQKVRCQVQLPIELIVPVSMSPHDGQLYRTLQNYARSPDKEARREAADQAACLLIRFIADHGGCIRRAAHGRRWS